MRKNRHRGFILMVAICISFVMILFAFILSNQERAMNGFTNITAFDANETITAQDVFSQIHGTLQKDIDGSAVHLPASLTASQNFPPSGTFEPDPANGILIAGTLTYQSPAPAAGPDSYADGPMASGIKVPDDHSLALLTASAVNGPAYAAQKIFTMYTSNYPYGMLAPAGDIKVQSVRSTSDYTGTISGVLANIYADTISTLSGQLNGRAYAKKTVATPGGGGIIYQKYANAVSMPSDFMSAFTTFKGNITAPFNNLDHIFNDLHDALHVDFTPWDALAIAAEELACAGNGGSVAPPDNFGGADSTQPTVAFTTPFGSTDAVDTEDGGNTLHFKSGTSLNIPSGENDELSFKKVLIEGGCVIVNKNSILHIKGDLDCSSGAIVLDEYATLAVDGTCTAQLLVMKYDNTNPNYVSTRSCLYGQKDINVTGGMSQVSGFSSSSDPVIPPPKDCPFGDTITYECNCACSYPFCCGPIISPLTVNPMCATYLGEVATRVSLLNGEHIGSYINGAGVPSGGDTTRVPGAFVACDGGDLTMGPTKAAGLFLTTGNHSISMNAATCIGAMWSERGNISAAGCDYLYFPYWTHVFGYDGTASPARCIDATDHHAIAYGKLP